MDILYAPWREEYDQAEKKLHENAAECVFCLRIKASDDNCSLLLRRNQHSIIIMNHYPYNPGHLMVIPIKHVSGLDELTVEIRSELMEAVNRSQMLLRQVLKVKGFNIGMNIGDTGGGGIPSHLHIHVLPRHRGDTTFLETIAQTKLISRDLQAVYEQLKAVF